MIVIDIGLLDLLSRQAKNCARRRMNLNLHESYADSSQRLLNAMEPNSYIQPHKHSVDPKPECFIGLKGRMALITFDASGIIENIVPFGPGENVVGVDLPADVWHTVICLVEGSVFFETKPGPFNPLTKKDMALWAPEEGSDGSLEYLAYLIKSVHSMLKLV